MAAPRKPRGAIQPPGGKTHEAVLLGLGVGDGETESDISHSLAAAGKSYQGQFAYVRATGQVAVADTDHLVRHKGPLRRPTSYEGPSKDFALCYSNSVLKPLLRLGTGTTEGDLDGRDAHLAGELERDLEAGDRDLPARRDLALDLGFVQHLVDEIEARHRLLSAQAASLNATDRGVVQLSFSCIHAWLRAAAGGTFAPEVEAATRAAPFDQLEGGWLDAPPSPAPTPGAEEGARGGKHSRGNRSIAPPSKACAPRSARRNRTC